MDDPDRARRPLWRRAFGRLSALFNTVFRDRNQVFVFDPASEPARLGSPDIARFDRPGDVPEPVLAAMRSAGGDVSMNADLKAIERGALLWTASFEGAVAGTVLGRRGRDLPRWFVPLAPQDWVLFRARTLSAFRGRGVYPSLLRHVALRETPAGARVWIDCKIFNHASVRGIEKAGFRRVGIFRPLPPEEGA